jgi:cytochrome P450
MPIQAINAALISTFFIGILLLSAYCWRWRRYIELGMKLPGPPALPVIGNCLHFTTDNLCILFQQFVKIAGTYGPVTRLWFGPVLAVVLTDPDSIEKVVKHDKIGSRGYLARKILGPVFRNGLITTDGDKWRTHRKIVSSALSTNILETFVENFAKNSDILASNLKALADGITAHDIVPYFIRCSLDIIYQTTSGIVTNAQNGSDNGTLESITTIIDIAAIRAMKPWLYIEWIFNATKLGKKYHNAVKHSHDTMFNEVEGKKGRRETAHKSSLNDEKPSLMDLLIQDGDISKEDIVGEIASIVGAGTESTSNVCCYVLALLGENQHIQAKVMQEQEDIFSDDILRTVSSEDLPRMVYLEQVGNSLLHSSIFSTIVAIFRYGMK